MQETNIVREKNGSQPPQKASARPRIAPPVDIFENADELLIVADVPGVASDAIELRIENGTLSLEARRAQGKEESPALAREYDEVDFAVTFRIPAWVDGAAVAAETKN